VQSAVSSIRDAQQQLDDLLSQPDAADLASAEAQVAGAQSKLDQLRNGADDLEVHASQIQLQQALVSLEEALVKFQDAQVRAPIAGVLTAVETEVGQTVRTGQAVVTIADPQDLAVEALVAEVDVAQLAAGQPAEIALDAIPGRTIAGTLTRIAPTSTGGDGAVNYEVEIQLAASELRNVRPGMTAVASLADQATRGGFLVPINALRQVDGRSVVEVQRAGRIVEIEVQPGAIQGEWQVVYAGSLQPTDAVVGSVTSHIDSSDNTSSGFPPRPSQMVAP
jgi:RND family efflux transporter MFP subunit